MDTPNFVTIARKDVPGAIRSAYRFHEKLAGVTRNAPVIPIRTVRAWSQENFAPLSNVSIPWQIASPAHTEHGMVHTRTQVLDSGRTKTHNVSGDSLIEATRKTNHARGASCTTRWGWAGSFATATAVETSNSAHGRYCWG